MPVQELFRCLHGSHLYGLDTPTSDRDYKGVFMPDIDDLLLGKSPRQLVSSTGDDSSKNTKDDVDTTLYSLPEFLRLACQGETIAIDMLYADTNFDCILSASEEWEFIVQNRHRFISKDMKAFMGYAKKQAHKYGVKGSRVADLEAVLNVVSDIQGGFEDEILYGLRLEAFKHSLPELTFCKIVTKDTGQQGFKEFYEVLGSLYQMSITVKQFKDAINYKWSQFGERAKAAKENKGVDWKAVSHALRAAYQLEELYKSGGISYPLKNRQFLLDVKLGNLDFVSEVQPVLEDLIVSVEKQAALSSWPTKVDKTFWDEWLLSIYRGNFNG